jgi:tetratricopeptide (TPR) repeat protein
MRRTLNLPLLLGLAVGTGVLGAAIHFLHGYQVRRNADALLAQADRAEGEGNLAQARDYLKQYLAFRPGDTDTLARYGLMLADRKVATTFAARFYAMRVLQQVLRQEPERRDIRRQVADLAMSLGRFTDARDDLEALLRAAPDDGELEGLLGRCQEAAGNYKAARAWYEKTIRDAPAGIEGYASLAYLLRLRADEVLGKTETPAGLGRRADAVMAQMVGANPKSFRAYLARARYQKRFPAQEDAAATLKAIERDVGRARQLAPGEAEVLLALAELEVDKGRLPEARECLRQACREHPRDWRVYEALARVEVRDGRGQAALRCLRDGLRELPEQTDLRWQLAELLVRLQQPGEAVEAIGHLRKGGFAPAALDFLNARLLMNEGKWVQAARLLEEGYPRLLGRGDRENNSFLSGLAQESGLLLGQCYEQMGDGERAYAAYSRVTARDPRSVLGRLGMAEARRNMGQPREALDQYWQLMRLANAPPAGWVEIARLALQLNLGSDRPDWEEVGQALAQAERLWPPPAEVVLLRAEALAAQKKYEEARAHIFATLLRAGPFFPGQTRPELIASTLLLQRRPPVGCWVALAFLDETQKRPESALATLDEAERLFGDRVELRLARAQLWARRGGTEARGNLGKLARGLEKFNPDEQRRILEGLANANSRAGNPVEAKKLWAQLAGQRDGDLKSRLVLLNLALGSDDDPLAQRLVQEIRQIEGEEGAFWRYGQVCRLLLQAARADNGPAREGLLAEARPLLSAVAARRPTWSRVPLCQAQIDDLLGREDAALANYLEAIQRGERGSLPLRRAVELLYTRQRYQEAYQILRELPRQTALSGDLQRVAAEVSLRAQDNEQALRLAEAAVAKDSTNYRDYLWLGQIYWSAGQPKKAGPMLYKARDLADQVPDTWVALILYLANNGQKEEAEREIVWAKGRLPGDQVALALAPCYEAVGRMDKADALYAAALKAGPQNRVTLRAVADYYVRTGKFQEARPHLEYLSKTSADAPEVAAWARRTLAVVMAIGGDYQQARDALALIGGDDLRRGESRTAPDLRVRAVLLAMQRGRRERREAIQILEGLIGQRVATPEDHFLLAQLYEANGDWPRARKRLLALAGLPGGGNALYLAHHARSMLRHDELAEAEQALANLKKVDPGGAVTVEIQARVLSKQGKGKEAVTLLKHHAQGRGVDIATVAALLEQLGEKDAAEEMYREHAGRAAGPAGILVLVGYLGRQKRLREALDASEPAWRTCPPEAVAQACLEAVAVAPGDRRQEERVDRWLTAALAKNPGSPQLTAALGHLRSLQGRDHEAERIYREALRRDSRDAVALNALAWLLALRGGRGAEALDLVQRAFQVIGPHSDLLDTQAVAHLSLGQGERAVSILQDVVTEDPSRAASYFHLAQAHETLKDHQAAAQALRRAQAAGLKVSDLHPLEHPAYERLRRVLGQK